MEDGLAQMYGEGAGQNTKHYYQKEGKKPKKGKCSCKGKCKKCTMGKKK